MPKSGVLPAPITSPTNGSNGLFGVASEQKLTILPAGKTYNEQASKASSDIEAQEASVADPWLRTFVIVGALVALLGVIVKFVWFPKS